MVGNTPMVKYKLPNNTALKVFIKLEGNNPSGSVKDRAALQILNKKIKTGELKKGKEILDASSGSFACSLALFGKILNYPTTVVTGSKLTKEKAWYIDYFGAKRISHGDTTIEGTAYCKKLIENNPDKYCFFDQLHNNENMNAHYLHTGPEILKDVPNIDFLVASVGSGGTIVGIGKYLKEKNSEIKIIAVVSASGTKIPGTGAFVDGDYETPTIKYAKEAGMFDYIVEVTAKKTQEQVRLLRDDGIFVGLSTGAVLAGLMQVSKSVSRERLS